MTDYRTVAKGSLGPFPDLEPLYFTGRLLVLTVGCNYYSDKGGFLWTNDESGPLALEREPENPYHSDSISCSWEGTTTRVGHLSRHVASILSPLVDCNIIGISARSTGIWHQSPYTMYTVLRLACRAQGKDLLFETLRRELFYVRETDSYLPASAATASEQAKQRSIVVGISPNDQFQAWWQ